jgi:hypothetical protein
MYFQCGGIMRTSVTDKGTQPVEGHVRGSRQAGFNLIEAAIVLGIVGLIVGGIWAAAASAYENMRQQGASKNLLSLAQSIRGFYAQNPATSIDSNIENLFSLGLLPADMVIGATGSHTMRHQWGGTVEILDASATTGLSSFEVKFNKINSEACRNFIMRNANSARGSGLLLVKTDAGTVMDIGTDSSATADIAAVNARCGTTGPKNVSFVFSVGG